MLKWQIGETTITQVLESTNDAITDMIPFLPVATPERLEEIPWLRPNFITPGGKLILNFQMLIIETPARRIVVDTCVGNDKTLALDTWANLQLPVLERLEAAGYPRESIDTVICTHLHIDHVGWNTMKSGGKWVPTFPNARYKLVEAEFRHWAAIEDEFGPIFAESVQPVFDAGLVDLVSPEHQFGDGVWFESTPGHTPGHVSVHIASKDEHAIITGDVLHHPCQIARPEWATPFDFDSPTAIATRQAFLERYADQPVLVLGTHFANPVAGHIVKDGARYRFAV